MDGDKNGEDTRPPLQPMATGRLFTPDSTVSPLQFVTFIGVVVIIVIVGTVVTRLFNFCSYCRTLTLLVLHRLVLLVLPLIGDYLSHLQQLVDLPL